MLNKSTRDTNVHYYCWSSNCYLR